jgi:hypothetical protein
VVVVELVVVGGPQGFGVQIRPSKKRPPAAKHWGRLTTAHWSKGPPGVLCVQHAEGGVVVGVVTGQLGSPGCIVQVQVPALHCSRSNDLQALRAAPDKPGHPAAISSEHAFEPQIGAAALAPETKTPTPSATAANVTTALRVIVEPPWPSHAKIDFGALPPRASSSTRVSMDQASLNEMLAEPSSMHDSRARDAIRAVLERKLADRMRAQTAALQDAVGQVGQLMSALTETLATSARRAERLNVWLVALTVAIVVLTAVMAVPAGHQIVALLRERPGAAERLDPSPQGSGATENQRGPCGVGT